VPAVVFRRKRDRAGSDDVFKRSVDERRATEDERPWFLEGDDDAPDLDIQAGIGSNLTDGELDD
jgi:hypothetical protein